MAWGGLFRRQGAWLFAAMALFAVVGVTGCSGDPGGANLFGEPDPKPGPPPDPKPDGGKDPEPGETVAGPEFDPAAGTFASPQTVAIRTATPGATIHYTLDGSAPGPASPVYTLPLAVAKTMTLKAFARKAGANDSEVRSAAYTIETPPGTVGAVDFEPNSGDFFNDTPIQLASPTAEAILCYTLDRSLPACNLVGRCAEGSSAYTGPVSISETDRQIRAVGCKLGMIPSKDSHAEYTLTAAKPTFDPASGSNLPSKVSIATATQGGVIHYVVGGGTPDCASPDTFTNQGTFPDVFSDATTVKAITCKEGYAASEVVTASYLGAVCTGDFTVSARAQLEALSHCQTLRGSLSIRDTDLTDLAALAHLAQITGSLSVTSNSALRSLHGLEALIDVGGDLVVKSNRSLTTMDDLAALRTVGGLLFVSNNAIVEWVGPARLTKVGNFSVSEDALVHLGGFASLAEVGGVFQITGNKELSTFDDMPALTTVRGQMTISSNPKLRAVTGFAKVHELGGLLIGTNEALTHFEAFPQLTTLHGDLAIGHDPHLMVLDLKSVETVDGILNVLDLPALPSLAGLGGLTTVRGWFMGLSGALGFADLHGLERLTTLKGSLFIGPSTGLSTLKGLNNLTTALSLDVSVNAQLENLHGLDKLETVPGIAGQAIRIYGNPALTEIGSLDALVRVDQPIEINDNRKLTHLGGLHALQSADFINVTIHPALTKLDGLDALVRTSRDLRIVANALTSLDELHALTNVGASLLIGEASLTNLTGLHSLSSVGDSLIISGCKVLPNVNGLGALKSVGGTLEIVHNDALTNLDDLAQLTTLGGAFHVGGNAALPMCQPEALAEKLKALGYAGPIDIQDNGGTGTCH